MRVIIMRFLKKILKMLTVILMLFVLGNVGMFVYCLITPKIQISRNQSYYLYDNKDELIFNNYSWLDLDEISDYLVEATLSTEDKYFYKHIGFDYLRIAKAMVSNKYYIGEFIRGSINNYPTVCEKFVFEL